MAACNCAGPLGNCPCNSRGGYYGGEAGTYNTKVIRPDIPASSPLDRLDRFSVPEIREFMAEQKVTGRGRNTKARMVELLADYLVSTDQVDLIAEYEERYGRVGSPWR